MRVKYWAVAIVLLLAIGQPARAAGGFQTLAAGDYQMLAAGAGAQLEMRQARIPAMDAAKFFIPAPGGVWRPLLMVGTEWRERYAGVFVKTSGGRLSVLIATLASRQATLVELRVSIRQLLDGLRSAGLIAGCAAESLRSGTCCGED